MKKPLFIIIMALSLFFYAPRLAAWSDDVSGVLMPEPRGGGFYSDQDAESAANPAPDEESGKPEVDIEWE